jgi:hypothetical protein
MTIADFRVTLLGCFVAVRWRQLKSAEVCCGSMLLKKALVIIGES